MQLTANLIVGNGSSSTVFSESVELQANTKVAFLVKATFIAEKVAIVAQFNTDNPGATVLNWQDYRVASGDPRVRLTNTGVLAAQTDADFTVTTNGIINTTAIYLMEFIPFAARWRLSFKPQTTSTIAIIDYVYVT